MAEHRWLLVDLGGFRKARHCPHCEALAHPWACFDDDGLVDCVCGIDKARRPERAEAVA